MDAAPLTRDQAERGLAFIKERWSPEDIEWLRKLPPDEAHLIVGLALLCAVPIEL